MPICAPRTWRISSFDILTKSCPAKNAFPASIFPGGEGINPNTESMVTLLPHPLSPTTPNVSPSINPNETPLTACTTPSGVLNVVSSPCTSRMKSGIRSIPLHNGVLELEVLECQADRIIPNSQRASTSTHL